MKRARDLDRPTTLDYNSRLLDDFVELHGDRLTGDCPAIVGGVGKLDGRPVVVIGHQKGHTIGELSARNFGMPIPAGYRKAARLFRLARKLRLPVISFIDTPGAYPGIVAVEMDARELLRLKIVDGVISEPDGGAGSDHAAAADRMRAALRNVLDDLSPLSPSCLIIQRHARFRAFGANTGTGTSDVRSAR